MHKVIESFLKMYVKENALEDLKEEDQFERFVNFSVFSNYFPDNFDIEEVTTGKDDEGIDGCIVIIGEELAVSSSDAESIFNRLRPRQNVSVVYVFCQAKRSEGFDSAEMLSFGAGVRRIFDPEASALVDETLQEFVKIHSVVVTNLSRVQNGRPECILNFACTGVYNESSGLSKYTKQLERELIATGLFNNVSFICIDRERMIKLWMQTREAVEASFNLKNFIPLPKIKNVQESYLALVSAIDFVNDVLTETDGRIRTSIFEQNVRAYLGDENPVNSKIRDCLHNPNRHDRFALLNNGITIVSPDVRIQNDRVSVRDFQIVNGCQTSHVLFRNQTSITNEVWVPIKIIEAEDPQVLGEVVEATNSQTDVEETQFYSISPFARKVEQYFNAFDTDDAHDRRLYFERRTRQYSGQGPSKFRIFDIEKLARAFAAMFLDVPHLAARYPTQTIKEKAAQLYQPDHRESAYYTAALALYRLELSLGNQYVPRKYQSQKWHMLLAIRYLIGGTKMPALNSKKLDTYCEKIIEVLSPGGKASAPPFLLGGSVIDSLGPTNRDRIRREKFTDDLKRALLTKSSEQGKTNINSKGKS